MDRLLYLRARLTHAGWPPRTRVGRVAFFVLGLDILLFALQKLAVLLRISSGETLGGWVSFLTFVCFVLFSWLLFRWTRNQLLWRLRNRLIVTYIFIGVIPVVLILLIGSIAGYLFAGQFATFIATEAIDEEVQALQHANTDIAIDLANQLRMGSPVSAVELKKVGGLKHLGGRFENADLIASNGKEAIVLHSSNPSEAEQLLIPRWLTGDFSGLVEDQGKLYLRSATRVPVGSEIITVLANAPMEGPW